MSRTDMGIEVYDSARTYRDGVSPSPILTDDKDGEAWEAWRGGEEFAAALDWRADAMSSVALFPATRGAGGAPDTPRTDPAAEALLARFRAVVPDILRHLDVTGRVLVARYRADGENVGPNGNEGGDPFRIWAGKANLGSVDKSAIWSLQVTNELTVKVNTAGDGQVIINAWHPDAEFPWRASSPTKYALNQIRAFQALTEAILATANSRAALRPAIVTSRRAQGALIGPPGTESFGGRQSVREMMRQLMAKLKGRSQASAAIGPHIEVDDVDKDFRLVDLGGEFDDKVAVLRPLVVEGWARTAPVPPQVVLGNENSNHWSSDVAYEQAKQIYLASDARFIAAIAGALVSSVLRREVYVGWAFQGLESEAWRSGLAGELGLTYDAPPTENDLRAVLWTRAMTARMEYADAAAYVNTIIAAWKGEQAPAAEALSPAPAAGPTAPAPPDEPMLPLGPDAT
jgi:hypothetical protein